MRSALQLLGGVAVAGAVAAGSTAFTAAGLTTSGSGTVNFAGGKLASLTVNGTVIDNITYAFADGAKTQINSVVLHFADTNSVGKTPTLVMSGGSGAAGAFTGFTCTAIATQSSTCTADADGYVGPTSEAITVV